MGLSDFWDSVVRGVVAIFGEADRFEAVQGSPIFGTVSGRGGASGCRSVGGLRLRWSGCQGVTLCEPFGGDLAGGVGVGSLLYREKSRTKKIDTKSKKFEKRA